MLDQATAFLNVLVGQTGLSHISFGNVAMIAVGIAMIAAAAVRRFEPLLLAGAGFACVLANLPGASTALPGGAALSQAADGGLFHYAWLGIADRVIPPLIFLCLGAMTDFGAVIANPKLIVLGAGAQLGVFAALLAAKASGFTLPEAGAIGILGAADGPIALFVAAKLAPQLLAPVAVLAYASLAVMAMLQPRALRLLGAAPERARTATKLERIAFPVAIAIFFGALFPQVAPLMIMLMLGNLLREVGPARRIQRAALGMTKVLTAVLAVAIGSSMAADSFLTEKTAQIFLVGLVALAFAAAAALATAKLMTAAVKTPVSPPAASGHLAPALMLKRGFKIVAQHETNNAILVHHAAGANLAGVFGAALSGAMLLAAFGGGAQPAPEIASGAPGGAVAFSIEAFLLTVAVALGIALVLEASPLLNRLASAFWGKRDERARPGRQKRAVPAPHMAAISAAVAAMVGPHRIVHIETVQGQGWQTEGRTAHHGSHTVFHPGASQRHPDNEGHRHHGTQIQNNGRRARV